MVFLSAIFYHAGASCNFTPAESTRKSYLQFKTLTFNSNQSKHYIVERSKNAWSIETAKPSPDQE